jgi:hypothetical protein
MVVKRTLSVSCVVALLLAARAPAGDGAKAFLDKVLRANGGAETLGKFKAARLKGKTTPYSKDGKKQLPSTFEWSYQGMSQGRVLSIFEEDGKEVRELNVINGDKGWVKRNAEAAEEMDAKALAGFKETIYVNWVLMLAPLKGEGFTLTLLKGEAKINKRPALGLKVERKGYNPLRLYFDKESSLLVKLVSKVRDEENETELLEEEYFANFKDVQGTKQAFRVVTRVGGKLTEELEVTELRLYERLDPKLFAKP